MYSNGVKIPEQFDDDKSGKQRTCNERLIRNMATTNIVQDWNFLIDCISSSNACNLSSSIFTKLGMTLFASSASTGHKLAI